MLKRLLTQHHNKNITYVLTNYFTLCSLPVKLVVRQNSRYCHLVFNRITLQDKQRYINALQLFINQYSKHFKFKQIETKGIKLQLTFIIK